MYCSVQKIDKYIYQYSLHMHGKQFTVNIHHTAKDCTVHTAHSLQSIYSERLLS